MQAQAPQIASASLASLSWVEAQKLLTDDAVVVLSVGNASKAHGPHLPLTADFIQAEYVKEQVARRTNVLVARSVGYGFYPPFGVPGIDDAAAERRAGPDRQYMQELRPQQ